MPKKVALAPGGGHALPGAGGSKTANVSGYTRSDGVVVAPHIRACPALTHSPRDGRQKSRDSSSSNIGDAKCMNDDSGGDGDSDGGSNNGGSTSKQAAGLAANSTPKSQSTKSCQLQGNHSKKVTLAPEGGHALSGDGIGSSGDAGSGPDPHLCPEGGGNSGDADPGSDPPLCSKDGGNSGDADPGSDPPPCSEDGGSSGDADPGSDPSPYSEDGIDSDDTGHGHSIVLTSTS